MITARVLLVLCLAATSACGPREHAAPSQPPPPPPAVSGLIHEPPIAQLSAAQLRALSLACEKYPAESAASAASAALTAPTARGPYAAKYCDEAMAAWSDAPLQLVIIPPR
jgi:hypothetical protein